MLYSRLFLVILFALLSQGCEKKPSKESLDKILLDISQGNCSELVDFYRFYRRCSRPSIFTSQHGRVKGCEEIEKMGSSLSGFLVLSLFSGPTSFKECSSDQDFLKKINTWDRKGGGSGRVSMSSSASSSLFLDE